MKLPKFQVSMAHLTGMVAVVAIGLIPLNNPTVLWLGLLMYVKFTVLIVATYLARYGRHRDWWFGFVTMGWSFTLFSVPGLWNAVSYGRQRTGLNYFDVTGSLGEILEKMKGDQANGKSVFWAGDEYAAIIQFWTTMALSFAGGYLSWMIAARTGKNRGA